MPLDRASEAAAALVLRMAGELGVKFEGKAVASSKLIAEELRNAYKEGEKKNAKRS